MTGRTRTRSLRALHWNEDKHPRDDRGRFSRTPGGRWAAKAVRQLEARFGDTGAAQFGDGRTGMPAGSIRRDTGKGSVLDLGSIRRRAAGNALQREHEASAARVQAEQGRALAQIDRQASESATKRAFAIKVGDRFMHKGAEVEAVGVPRAGRKAGQQVTVVKVKRVSDGKTGPITIEGDSVRMAGPAESKAFVEVPVGRGPGGTRVDKSSVPVKAGGVTTTPQDRQQAAIALGTSFSGNPYSKLPTLEALTDDDFKALTPEQQDNVRFLASKIAGNQTGEARYRAQVLEGRFGKWGAPTQQAGGVGTPNRNAALDRRRAAVAAGQSATEPRARGRSVNEMQALARKYPGVKFHDGSTTFATSDYRSQVMVSSGANREWLSSRDGGEWQSHGNDLEGALKAAFEGRQAGGVGTPDSTPAFKSGAKVVIGGRLAEVTKAEKRHGQEGYQVRPLSDIETGPGGYTSWYPADQIETADMGQWSYDINANRYRKARQVPEVKAPEVKALSNADIYRQHQNLTRAEFDALPAERQAAILADLRKVRDSGDEKSRTIASNRTTMGTTIRGLVPANHVEGAKAKLRELTYTAPPPVDNSIEGRAARLKAGDVSGITGTIDELHQVARAAGIGGYSASWKRDKLVSYLTDMVRLGDRMPARNDRGEYEPAVVAEAMRGMSAVDARRVLDVIEARNGVTKTDMAAVAKILGGKLTGDKNAHMNQLSKLASEARAQEPSAGEQFATETRAALAGGGIDVGRGPIPGAQLPGTARREAAAGTVQATADKLKAATTRAEGDAAVADLKGADLRLVAENLNINIGGLKVADARQRIVEATVGARLNSAAIRDRSNFQGAGYLGGGGGTPGRTMSVNATAGGVATQPRTRKALDGLDAATTREQATAALQGATLGDLEKIYQELRAKRIARQGGPTPFDDVKLAGNKREAVEQIVELAVGRRLDADAADRASRRAGGRSPGGKA